MRQLFTHTYARRAEFYWGFWHKCGTEEALPRHLQPHCNSSSAATDRCSSTISHIKSNFLLFHFQFKRAAPPTTRRRARAASRSRARRRQGHRATTNTRPSLEAIRALFAQVRRNPEAAVRTERTPQRIFGWLRRQRSARILPRRFFGRIVRAAVSLILVGTYLTGGRGKTD